MDTLIKFRQKNFAGVAKNVVKYVKTPQGILTVTGIGLSGANLATNLSRHNKDREYQREQLKAMNNLSGTLGNFNSTMKRNMQQQKEIMAHQKEVAQRYTIPRVQTTAEQQHKKSRFTLFRFGNQ